MPVVYKCDRDQCDEEIETKNGIPLSGASKLVRPAKADAYLCAECTTRALAH